MHKKLDNLAVLLLVIAGIVWGVLGLYQLNLVEYIFNREWLIRAVYVLFGFAFVYHLVSCRKEKKRQKTKR